MTLANIRSLLFIVILNNNNLFYILRTRAYTLFHTKHAVSLNLHVRRMRHRQRAVCKDRRQVFL